MEPGSSDCGAAADPDGVGAGDVASGAVVGTPPAGAVAETGIAGSRVGGAWRGLEATPADSVEGTPGPESS